MVLIDQTAHCIRACWSWSSFSPFQCLPEARLETVVTIIIYVRAISIRGEWNTQSCKAAIHNTTFNRISVKKIFRLHFERVKWEYSKYVLSVVFWHSIRHPLKPFRNVYKFGKNGRRIEPELGEMVYNVCVWWWFECACVLFTVIQKLMRHKQYTKASWKWCQQENPLCELNKNPVAYWTLLFDYSYSFCVYFAIAVYCPPLSWSAVHWTIERKKKKNRTPN